MCTILDDAQPVIALFSFMSLPFLIFLFISVSFSLICVILSSMDFSLQRARRDVDRGVPLRSPFSPRGNLQASTCSN